MQTFENFLLQNYSTEFLDIAHKYSLGTCNLVSSNCGATYIFSEMITKHSLNTANLKQTLEKSSSPKVLDRILRYYILIVLAYVLFNNNQRQFEHSKFIKKFENFLL